MFYLTFFIWTSYIVLLEMDNYKFRLFLHFWLNATLWTPLVLMFSHSAPSHFWFKTSNLKHLITDVQHFSRGEMHLSYSPTCSTVKCEVLRPTNHLWPKLGQQHNNDLKQSRKPTTGSWTRRAMASETLQWV